MKEMLLCAACATVIASQCLAEEVSIHPYVDLNGDEVDGMWNLLYENGSTSVNDRTNSILIEGDHGISWRFERTSNGPCARRRESPAPSETCADTIYVFPPEGYIAIPDVATVNERDAAVILIVRGGLS